MPHPHETPFHYNEDLVASCANSPLAQSLMISQEGGVRQDADGIIPPPIGGNTRDCLTLLHQHASHYNRPAFSSKEGQFWDEWTATLHTGAKLHTHNIVMSSRHEAFIQNVIFVHGHNKESTNHKVALNRFSDVPLNEFPAISKSHHHQQQQQQLLHEEINSSSQPMAFNFGDDPMFLQLDNDNIIIEIASKIQRRRSIRSNDNHLFLSSNKSFIANIFQAFRDSWWWVGQLSSSSSSSSPNFQPPKNSKQNRKSSSFLIDKQNELGVLENSQGGDGGGGENDDDDIDHNYETYLNWATEENPDGVAIVHPPVDQGLCGSCWAISALGTMESSIARNMAYMGYETAYNEAVKKSSQRHLRDEEEVGGKNDVESPSLLLEDSRTLAILAAQLVEGKSINVADLSVQELIDCDTRYDQGCAGGNPLLAFYYLHKHGITSSKNYPYVGTQNVCKEHKVLQPIATVETWGILTPDHENNLEKVIRYIGPVAAGLGAYDPAFLSYSGGVFTSNEGSRCNHLVADHAMLIVGYGEEVANDGTKSKYWICRNSWGSGWGEGGYVKMARLGGTKGEKGICGISRSPSVALGGMFTNDVLLDLDENDLKNTYFGKRHSAGKDDDESTISRASEQIRSIIHQIRIRLGLMQTGIVMYTLSGNEKNEPNRIMLCSMGIVFIITGILVSYALHRNRCRSAERQRRRSTFRTTLRTDSASTVGTHPSTLGVYHGVVGAERRPLLQKISVPLYTA